MNLESKLISGAVRRVLEKDVMCIVAIMNNIANPRKIARRILPDVKSELGFEPKLGSVSRVVERYVEEIGGTGKLAGYDIAKIREAFSKTKVSVRSDIAVLEIRMTKNFGEKLTKLVEYVYSKEEKPLINVIYGHSFITVFVDQDDLEKAKKIIGATNIVSCMKDKAALSIISRPDVLEVPGFAAYVFSVLGLCGINIPEVLSSYNEGIMILDEKDADRAYKVLHEEIKRTRGHSKDLL
jgi:aspartokinase